MSKYIIDIEEKPLCVFDKDTQTYFPRLWRVKGFNSLVFDKEGLSRLKELTADYVNEHFGILIDDAYNAGFENGKKEAESSEAIEQAKADAFNKGMLFKEEKIHDAFLRGVEKGKVQGQNEAWECARKIVCDDSCGGMSMKELVEIFNKSSDAYILRDFTAQQAIEMLKAHKQEKDDNIEVGDEICNIDTDRNDTGIVTWRAHDDIYVMWTDGSAGRRNIKDYRKTGRHFDIQSILEAMKND